MANRVTALEARNLRLTYGDTVAVDNVSLTVLAGESVALMGPSGSGKSSLLHCLAGVLRPESGEVLVGGTRLDQLSDYQRSRLRLTRMGMVFQFGNLVPELTLLENVMLPLQLMGTRAAEARSRALTVLDELGVADVSARPAGAVSGGQAQRAAVARALVHRPPVVFADEPTGALDTLNADKVLGALLTMASDMEAAVVVVTHENRVAAHCSRLVSMRDGSLRSSSDVLT